MRYRVMRRGHKVGHKPLPYGELVTAKDLGVEDAALQPFVARGVLRPAGAAPTPRRSRKTELSPDVEAQTGNKDD